MKLKKKRLLAGPGKDVYNGSLYWSQWRKKRKAEDLAEEAKWCTKLDSFITMKKRETVRPVPCIDLTADNDTVDDLPTMPPTEIVDYIGIQTDDVECTISGDIDSLISYNVGSRYHTNLCIEMSILIRQSISWTAFNLNLKLHKHRQTVT